MANAYKQLAREQYTTLVNTAALSLSRLVFPKEGWIRSVRKALGMSGSDLSKHLNSSRTGAAYLEKAEVDGRITINKLKEAAEALDCHLVYGFVPNTSIDESISKQAELKARHLSQYVDTQMVLEAQSLSPKELKAEILRLKEKLIREMPNDLWKL
ncbi:MAG: mobile mystery protein A [Gammaproteobacteria bacterium]|nr:mobile mystery protein A [Gammaproteobacteria bacterium]